QITIMEGFLGEVRLFSSNFAPRDWAICDGQVLAISQNQGLFSIIGAAYGGDGVTTFALPDARGRCVLGAGTGTTGIVGTNNEKPLTPRNLGTKTGSEELYMTNATMPPHKHTVVTQYGSADGIDAPLSQMFGSLIMSAGAGKMYADTSDAYMNSDLAVVAPMPAPDPIDNMQAFLAVNFIICVSGSFPSRI
ncbi:MAG: tail fiber protein, partial [Bacteroidota bacterium]